jgi:hypothetical protein
MNPNEKCNCPASPVSPGGLLTYSGGISNVGNISLNNVVVVGNQPVFDTITAAIGMVTVSWPAAVGVNYTPQSPSSATDPVWIDIAGNVTASGAAASKEEPIESGQKRFYRVRVTRK